MNTNSPVRPLRDSGTICSPDLQRAGSQDARFLVLGQVRRGRPLIFRDLLVLHGRDRVLRFRLGCRRGAGVAALHHVLIARLVQGVGVIVSALVPSGILVKEIGLLLLFEVYRISKVGWQC